jgi:hypothetical protein
MRVLKRILIGLAVVVVLFGLLQLVPYGREHSNPPITCSSAKSYPSGAWLPQTLPPTSILLRWIMSMPSFIGAVK